MHPQVPAVWNAKMKEYLGVTPENDAQGCLQDVHWSAGRERRLLYFLGVLGGLVELLSVGRDLEAF
jgi:Zn-dependent M32 family carboxypeptidase